MTATRTDSVDTTRLEQECAQTRAGRRLARILHTYEGEVTTMTLVHEDVRQHVTEALREMNRSATQDVVDRDCVRAVSVVLDDLDRLGGGELRSTVALLREELAHARGHSFHEALA